MNEAQTVINRIVRRYLERENLSQRGLASKLGTNATWLNTRLKDRTAWTLADLDRLQDIGVPISLSIGTDTEAVKA